MSAGWVNPLTVYLNGFANGSRSVSEMTQVVPTTGVPSIIPSTLPAPYDRASGTVSSSGASGFNEGPSFFSGVSGGRTYSFVTGGPTVYDDTFAGYATSQWMGFAFDAGTPYVDLFTEITASLALYYEFNGAIMCSLLGIGCASPEYDPSGAYFWQGATPGDLGAPGGHADWFDDTKTKLLLPGQEITFTRASPDSSSGHGIQVHSTAAGITVDNVGGLTVPATLTGTWIQAWMYVAVPAPSAVVTDPRRWQEPWAGPASSNRVWNTHVGGNNDPLPPVEEIPLGVAPPLRQYPRSDWLTGGAYRGRAGHSTSRQMSARQGWAGTHL